MIQTVLNEMQSRNYLKDYSVSMSAYALLKKGDDIDSALSGLKYPVVMKVLSDKIVHKSDAGAVILNIACREDAVRAEKELYRRALEYGAAMEDIEGLIVEEQISGVAEMIIGLKRDPVFGPVMVVGSGGILVELMQDAELGVCPLTDEDIEAMLGRIKGIRLLKGFRGRPEGDIPAFVSLIRKISEMAVSADNWTEIDINPVIVGRKGEGAHAVDARVVLISRENDPS